jgi:LysR family nitrogen assimilation transcriptional regulator
LDIRQLRYFARIIELGSFTRASEALRVSQPSLGAHIRNLEHELRTQLLIRHSRGIEPTEAGMLLFERARKILGELDEARNLLKDYSGSAGGSVLLGITPCLETSLVATIIEQCAREMPGVALNTFESMNMGVIEAVQDERVELGIVHYLPEPPTSLAAERLAEDYAVLIRAADERSCAGGDTIPLADALRYPLVMPPAPHHLRDRVEAAARDVGADVTVRFESQSVALMIELVERNIAASIIPVGAVADRLTLGTLTAQRIVMPEFGIPMSLVYKAKRPMSKATASVRALVTECFADRGAANRGALFSAGKVRRLAGGRGA